MAKAKVNKMGPVVELPECPVCLETMSAPIFQCQSGHSLCHSCTKSLMPPICPICRQTMTQMRNWQLEDLISKATLNCPNLSSGCNYKTGAALMENHIKECIFRVMTCPLGIFGRCSWSGALKEMVNHFAGCHPQNMLLNLDQDITMDNISITKDDRFVYIVPQGKMIYILTLKIDIHLKMAYWVVQLIGCKKVAQNHVYEISISGLQDSRRRVTYNDHCYSDAMDINEIFRSAKCCVMPLNFFAHFIKQNSVAFKLIVKKNQPTFTKQPSTGPQQCNPNTVNKNPSKFRTKSPSPMTQGPKAPFRNNRNKKPQP